MNRRGFLGGILAAAVAPGFVRAGVLMPIAPQLVDNLGRSLKQMDEIRPFVMELAGRRVGTIFGTGLVAGEVISIAGHAGLFKITNVIGGFARVESAPLIWRPAS